MSGWPNPSEPTSFDNMGSQIVPVSGEFLPDPTTPGQKASQRLRLSSLADVKRQMRLIFIEARNGELSTTEAAKFFWMLDRLGNLIADGELEERVNQLESGRD